MKKYLEDLRKKHHLYAWEKDYRTRGQLWRETGFTPFAFQEIPNKATVLEVGVGDGKLAAVLARKGFNVTGIDVSPSAIALAQKNLTEKKLKAKLITDDFLSFKTTKKFDAVIFHHILGHLKEEERIKAIQIAKQLLKEHGTIYFEDFEPEDFRYGKGTEIEKNTFRRGNNILYHYFTLQEVEDLFSQFKKNQLKTETVEKSKLKQKRSVIRGVFQLQKRDH